MKVVNDIWRQLVGRRLLPLAVILVAGLAAVPFTLAKDPESPPAPALKPVDESAAEATKTIVSLAATDTTDRKVIGSKANPFASDRLPKAKQDATSGPKAANVPDTDVDVDGGTGTPSTGGGTTPATGTPPAPGTPTTPTPKTYDKYDLTVRFGESSGELNRMTLKRLQPLPKSELPTLIYLGVSRDGKSAIFLVEKGVQAVGDGSCAPTPDECETVRLKAGETEFFDVVDETGTVSAQYQLDLIKIHKSSTSSATRAWASSKAGRQLLDDRAEESGALPYRFDAASGTLKRRAGVVGAVARTSAAIG